MVSKLAYFFWKVCGCCVLQTGRDMGKLLHKFGKSGDIKSVACQMILQMVLPHKPLVTMLTYKLLLRLVSQHVSSQISALSERFVADIANMRFLTWFLIVVQSHVQLEVMFG